jgi:hypothetical protein
MITLTLRQAFAARCGGDESRWLPFLEGYSVAMQRIVSKVRELAVDPMLTPEAAESLLLLMKDVSEMSEEATALAKLRKAAGEWR